MKLLHATNLFIRSLLFSLYVSITASFYCILCLFTWPFPLRYRYALVVQWTRLTTYVLRKLCHVDYRIEGLENIPRDRNGIVLSKHQSTWETFLLPRFFNQAAIILKRELLWVPFFGWGLATIDPIAINRSDRASAMEQIIKKGKQCLAAGRWILVFPEGTRTPVGKVGKYRIGGARLAVATGSPIIPVAHNAGHFWPKRTFIKRPGTIHVVIGPLIETEGKTAEAILEQVKNWIEGTILKIEADRAHSRAIKVK